MTHGLPFALTDKLLARFWSKVDKRGPEECWPWTGSARPRGYGRMMTEAGACNVTHIALAQDGRPRPTLAHGALHECDNPPCCNPAHLWWGTQAENSADRDSKGRHACGRGETHGSRTKPESIKRGSDHGRAKLTESDIPKIRADPRFQYVIAREYGVTQRAICMVKTGKSWKHVQ